MLREFGKPMLADNKPFNPEKVAEHLPVWGSPKLDGIRVLIKDGVGYSRSLKPLPNKDFQRKIRDNAELLEGIDGEVIIGDPTAPDCYSKTFTACMSEEGEFDHNIAAFDLWNRPDIYHTRYGILYNMSAMKLSWVTPLHQTFLESLEAVEKYAKMNFADGFEGSILRDPNTYYKNGRATTNQGQLYKMKSKVSTEVIITGFEELMHNDNEAFTNETGHTARSSHQENKRGGDTLGALLCSGIFNDGRTYNVRVGVFRGFTKPQLKEIWDNRLQYVGKYAKIEYMDIGVKDAPRHPVFVGFRDPMDM